MYQRIGEAVSVAGVYRAGHFVPKKFKWRQRVLPIQAVHSVHDFKDGAVRKRRFSVSARNTVFLLEFNRDLETWFLDQLWVEEGS